MHVMFKTGLLRAVAWPVLAAAGMALTATPAAALDSRTYVVWWFAQAAYSQDGDCGPTGINPKMTEQFVPNLKRLGYTGAQIEEIMKTKGGDDEDGGAGGWEKQTLRQIMNERARIGGKPANAFMHPAAVIDPMLKTVIGKYAYGFNLDGKGQDDPKAFIDPQTQERGIDNQLFRAMGCLEGFRGSLVNHPTFWYWIWQTIRDSQPAWLVTVSGDDLQKDGPITITFDRALEYMTSNNGGEARADVTYRVDPDPRSHNVFKGEIRNGVATVTEHKNFQMLQNSWGVPELNLHNFHLRMTVNPDRSMEAIIGGYQPWHHLYFAFAHGGLSREISSGSIPGIYYLLKQQADAEPDPKTGRNTAISATYHIKAVPAFIATEPSSVAGAPAAGRAPAGAQR